MTLGRKLSIIAGLYVIEGFPMGAFRDFWSVVLRREGMSLTELGLLSSLAVVWSLKAAWSPLVDRFGEERRWIGGSLAVMVLAFVAGAHLDSSQLGPALFLAVLALCAASATQDIAIDGYTIGLVSPGEEGSANSVRNVCYRLGMILAGSLLLLSDRLGYRVSFYAAAGLSAALAASLLAFPRVAPARGQREPLREAVRRWLRRSGVGSVSAFVLLYRIGDIAMGPMVRPFWVDHGFSDSEIGLVTNVVGILVFIAGAVVGGVVVSRVGIARALLVLGALALASNGVYALAALPAEPTRLAVYGASVVESFCGGLASNAFVSYLMNICDRRHAAVQYALLTAIYAAPGLVAGAASGWLSERLGFALFFALTGLLALPAFAFLPGARRWIQAPAAGATP